MKRAAKSSTASVGLILHSSLLSLTLGLAVTLTIVLASAWHEFSWARHVQAVAAFDRITYETVAGARLVRAQVLGAHYGDDNPTPKFKKLHQDYDAMLARASASMDPKIIPGAGDRIASIRERWVGMQPAWQEIETLDLSLPREMRDKSMSKWFEAATAVITELLDLARIESGEIRLTDPMIAELVTARQLAWDIREAVGDECLLIRRHVVGGRRAPPELRAKITVLREDVRATWRILDDLLARPGAPVELLHAIATAKAAGEKSTVQRDAIYQGLLTNDRQALAERKLSPDQWNDVCVANQIPALMNVGAIAVDLIDRHAEMSKRQAARRLVLVIVGLVGVAVISAFALWLVRNRVLRPVKVLTDAIEHLTRRDYSMPVPQLPQRDEFGSMAATLEALRLGALDAEKAAAERQHSQKLEALGTLAGGIAHDLNNTLVPVLSLAKVTARRLAEGSRERTNLETIHTAGTRARDLVKQILAFARRERVEKQPVDLAALTREALRLLRASIPATIRLVEEIDDVPPVLGDPGQLRQVIINVVTNGAQAIDGRIGQISVSLTERGRPDSVTGHKLVRLAIRDTGVGMDEHTLGRIFDPFFTTKPVGEGTGLGLSVVHGIVADHGGRIEVASHPGDGTQFQIYLPTLGTGASAAEARATSRKAV
ncbi:MAG TPA: ATP-binding protein [Stellaceae bacterium]